MLCRLRDCSDKDVFKTTKTPVEWSPHTSECNVCKVGSISVLRGRPKKQKTHKSESDVANGYSDTDSASSEDENEGEKEACEAMKIIQDNLPLLDNDMGRFICEDLASRNGLFVVDPQNISKSLEKIPSEIIQGLVREIFMAQKDSIQKDITICKGNSLSSITKFDTESWLSSRNRVVWAAINGLTGSRNNIPPIKKVSAMDHMYSLVQPNFISPCMFACNLVMYSICRSRMVANIYGKFHPGGLYNTVKSFLGGLTLNVPELPAGDVLVAVDNDQVLVKHWTVRKDNRAQISVLTSVCCAELPDKASQLQKDENLAPRNWTKNLCDLEKTPSLSEEDHKILRYESDISSDKKRPRT